MPLPAGLTHFVANESVVSALILGMPRPLVGIRLLVRSPFPSRLKKNLAPRYDSGAIQMFGVLFSQIGIGPDYARNICNRVNFVPAPSAVYYSAQRKRSIEGA